MTSRKLATLALAVSAMLGALALGVNSASARSGGHGYRGGHHHRFHGHYHGRHWGHRDHRHHWGHGWHGGWGYAAYGGDCFYTRFGRLVCRY